MGHSPAHRRERGGAPFGLRPHSVPLVFQEQSLFITERRTAEKVVSEDGYSSFLFNPLCGDFQLSPREFYLSLIKSGTPGCRYHNCVAFGKYDPSRRPSYTIRKRAHAVTRIAASRVVKVLIGGPFGMEPPVRSSHRAPAVRMMLRKLSYRRMVQKSAHPADR